MEEFNYPSEDDDIEITINTNSQKVTHKHGIRARCSCFCSTRTPRYERNTPAETLAVRKKKTISEYKSRLITLMQILLPTMNLSACSSTLSRLIITKINLKTSHFDMYH